MCDGIKKIEGIGQVARTAHEKWLQHAVGYTQDETQKGYIHVEEKKSFTERGFGDINWIQLILNTAQ